MLVAVACDTGKCWTALQLSGGRVHADLQSKFGVPSAGTCAAAAVPPHTQSILWAAVGDIHGDLQKAVSLLKLAGCVEEVNRRCIWTGGNTTVVQLGDVLDRGSQEIGERSV